MYWPLLLLCIFWRVHSLSAEQTTVPWPASIMSRSRKPVPHSTPLTIYTSSDDNIPPLKSTLAASSTGRSEEEVSILLSFKALITGDPSGALESWKNGSSHCSWQGILCGADGLVSEVNLSGLGLSGTLSPSLPLLSGLSSIDLSDNLLAGPLPPSLCNPSTLTLTNLTLKNNSFSGTIPRSLGNCTSLTSISLYFNSLSGQIPHEISSLSNLEILALSFNELNGSLPIPILANCTKLTTLALSLNLFTGPLPREIGKLKNMQNLWLDNNGFSGRLPSELGNLTQLTLLQLDTNNFTGSIPSSLGQLTSLTVLLSLSINQLSGPIPSQLGNLSNLTIITLRGNYLNGTIPKELSNMQAVQGLYLEENMLEGTIPPEFANCTSLQQLRLDSNRLTGSIPDALGRLQHLTLLYMHVNMLHGIIPTSLAGLSSLQDLSLGFNALSGPIPPSLASLSTIAFNFSLPHNSLNGTIPSGLGLMIHVQIIDLSANNLSGTIPADIGDCVNLMQLNLSFNVLTGEIPKSFQGLEFLQILDLSQNALFGEIPSSLVNLTQLRYIDLSYNNLTGPIPSSGVFARMNASSFQGNPGLCGPPLIRACPEVASVLQLSSPKKGLKVGFKILIAILSLFFVCALFLMLLGFLRRKRKKTASPNGLTSSESVSDFSKQLRRFTARELEVATENFCESRLIGTGGMSKVYKATDVVVRLAPTVRQVEAAVKVLSMDHSPCFSVELEALGSIKHRNLVKFYGFCEYGNFQALVLQLLSNGSLQDQLYAPTAAALSISTRVRIALDVAHGLAYLHHGLAIQIVHRDVKPTNILFDQDMVAKLADFGIAKLLDEDEVHSKIRGSVGYIAPEYGESTRVSTKGDVYSFGVVILEMLTRKGPTNDMFGSIGVSLPMWVRSAYPDRVSEILDPQLRNREHVVHDNEEAIKAMLELGLCCTERNPKDRPDMKAVVAKLTFIGSCLSNSLITQSTSSLSHDEVALLKKQRKGCGQGHF